MKNLTEYIRIVHRLMFGQYLDRLGACLRSVSFVFFAVIAFCFLSTSATYSQQECNSIKQMLFVFDVSGSMKANERLAETKKFALRTLQERSVENLLYKVISYGGNCNDVVVEVDWTRDLTVVGAGIKGLYAHGETPLASSLDLTIDEIKKSAYPEETQVCLMNNAANSCGSVKEILDKRLLEIPCVKFYTIGIELDELSPVIREKASQDLALIASQTRGAFTPLSDIRELTGITLKDSGLTIVPVQFVPRKKTQVAALQPASTAEEKSSTGSLQTSSNTSPDANKNLTTTQQNDSARITTTSGAKKSSTSATQTFAENTPPQSESSAKRQDSSQQSTQISPSSKNAGHSSSSVAPVTVQKSAKEGNAVKKNTSKARSSRKETKTSDSTAQNNSSESWQWKAVATISQDKKETKQQDKQQEKQQKKKQQLAAEEKKDAGSSQTSLQSYPNKSRANTQPIHHASEQSTTDPRQKGRIQDNKRIGGESFVIQQALGEAIKPVWDSIPTYPFVFEFSTKSTLLTPESRRQFIELLQYIKQQYMAKPSLQITVEGHSSDEGSRVENLRLAVSRASEIAAQIRKKVGLQDTAVKWNAFGTLKPVFDNQSPLARVKNRRVEVLVRW